MQKKYLLSGLVGLGLILLVSGCGKVTINNLTPQQKTKAESQLSSILIVTRAIDHEQMNLENFVKVYSRSIPSGSENVSALDSLVMGTTSNFEKEEKNFPITVVFDSEGNLILDISKDSLKLENADYNLEGAHTMSSVESGLKGAVKAHIKFLEDEKKLQDMLNTVSNN